MVIIRPLHEVRMGGQEIVKNLASKHSADLVRQTRKDNEEALAILKASGIEFVSPTADQLAAMDGGRNLWVPDTIAAGTFGSTNMV